MIAALILAAGRGTRFGTADVVSKLLAKIEGKPLVHHVARAALASAARPIVIVTGHAADEIGEALEGLNLWRVTNPDYATGLASSLRRGLAALPEEVAGAIILLGDMPSVHPATLDRLITAFRDAPDADAVVPVHQGAWGNPVLIGRPLFADIAQLEGDAGARAILRQDGRHVIACAVEDAGVLLDIDRPEDLSGAASHVG